jgi:hypothetical protein
MAVLMHRGMRAWMNACPGPSAPLSAKVCTRSEPPLIPQGLQTEIVLILSGMLLHWQEAHT